MKLKRARSSLLALALVLVALVLAAGPAEAAIGPWIDAHPKIAYSIKWEVTRDNYPDSYDQKESAKRSWPDWTPEMKQGLETAFTDAQAWFHGSDPFHNLNETIQYPPTNINPQVAVDDAMPFMTVDQTYAWDMYLRWVAQTLLVETEGAFPWSILDYDTEELKVLLDSTAMFARIDDTQMSMDTGNAGSTLYVRTAGNLGESLMAPPRYTYAFLHNGGLIGANRQATIVNLLDWASAHLVHFFGSESYKNNEDHWQFRGPPPITRIIEGTIRATETTPQHWTEGCHGSTGFYRNVLRAANIPVEIVNRCGHSLPYFVTEGRYMDHGDNPYNLDFKSFGLSTSRLLIDVPTEQAWFGDNLYNNTDFCDGPNQSGAVSRQIFVLKGQVEICNDGIDNDGDGAIDCADSDCPARPLTGPLKVTALDGRDQLRFGLDVSISNGKLLVGAQGTSNAASARGAAYVMSYQKGLGWTQEAKLVPSNAADANFFGSTLALDGDTALVAGSDEENGVGAAYIFSRKANGSWTQDAILTPSDAHANERFGSAAALQGTTAVVGAFEDNGLIGSVYVFTRNAAGAWQGTQKLGANDGQVNDLFGYSVALDGDALVVGAYGTAQAGQQTGAAYVFRRTSGVWAQETKLQAGSPIQLGKFGWSVAVRGTRAIVGGPGDFQVPGAASIFEYNATARTWSAPTELTSPSDFDPLNPDGFGYDVSLAGATAVVGAYGEDQATGAAYQFTLGGGVWGLTKTLKPQNGILGDRFGAAAPTDGGSIVVGAPIDGNEGFSTGAVYVYDLGASPRGQCIGQGAAQTGNPDVSLTFTSVARGGTTTVTASTTAPALPIGFQVGTPPTYYDVTTTSDFSGPVKVCIDYSKVSYQNESSLQLLHYQNGAWVNLCQAAAGCTQDLARHVLCGFSDTLSPFAVAEIAMFNNVSVPSGSASASAIFLAQNFPSVGDVLQLDVLLKAPQPNKSWYGQIQLTATMESEGINNQDMGTVQLTGLPLGTRRTISFSVPANVRARLLGGIAAGRFTARLNTPAGAPAILINNLRFAGSLVKRAATAPRRSSIPDLLSFEAATDWTPASATVALVHDQVTAGAGALRVHRLATTASVRSADFFTNELGTVGATLAVDAFVPAPAPAWGDVQASVACPFGTNIYIGQQQLAGHPAGSFSTFSFPIPAQAAAALKTKDQSCSLTLVIDGPTGGDFTLDRLRLN